MRLDISLGGHAMNNKQDTSKNSVENLEKYKELENRVIKFIKEKSLISDGDTVVVATSGGADSMALLYMTNNLASRGLLAKDVNIAAVTVNHGIRGETADRDMMHVENFCKSIGVRCVTFNAKTDGTKVPPDASEEWARQLRYRYFSKLPEILNVKSSKLKIATAHTKSDQAETMLFRLSRNSSYKSLTGIPVKRGNFIRPFLNLTRKEIEFICKANNLDFMTDETNLTDDYCRNKIRHSVLPVMMQINSGAMSHLADLAEFNDKLDKYFIEKAKIIDKATKTAKFKWSVDKIKKYHELEINAFINYIIESFGEQPSKVNMSLLYDLINAGHGSVEISKELTAKIETYSDSDGKAYKNLTFVTSEKDVIPEKFSKTLADYLDTHGTYTMNHIDRRYNLVIMKVDLSEAKKFVQSNGIRSLSMLATYEKLLKSNLILGGTDPNATFSPACRPPRKIRKLYKEMQIVPANISKVPCIKDVHGDVKWVYNVGFTDGFSPFDKDLKSTEALRNSKKPNNIYIVTAV